MRIMVNIECIKTLMKHTFKSSVRAPLEKFIVVLCFFGVFCTRFFQVESILQAKNLNSGQATESMGMRLEHLQLRDVIA